MHKTRFFFARQTRLKNKKVSAHTKNKKKVSSNKRQKNLMEVLTKISCACITEEFTVQLQSYHTTYHSYQILRTN